MYKILFIKQKLITWVHFKSVKHAHVLKKQGLSVKELQSTGQPWLKTNGQKIQIIFCASVHPVSHYLPGHSVRSI